MGLAQPAKKVADTIGDRRAGGARLGIAEIGVAQFPNSADKAVLLVKLADEAMYEVKRPWKSCVRRAGHLVNVPEVDSPRS